MQSHHLALSGSNTYSGPTTISQGELVVDGSLASPVTVNSGGALGGTGYLSSVTVNAGGTLAPGDPLGVLHLSGNLVLAANAAMDYELDTPGNGYDQLEISGLATLNGTLNVNLLSGFSPSDGDSFEILEGRTTGSFSQINLPPLSNGLRWDTSNLYTTGEIGVVPEPSTLALLAAGAIGLLGYAWRQRRQAAQGYSPATCGGRAASGQAAYRASPPAVALLLSAHPTATLHPTSPPRIADSAPAFACWMFWPRRPIAAIRRSSAMKRRRPKGLFVRLSASGFPHWLYFAGRP